MTERLSIVYEWRTIVLPAVSSSALVQSALEEACKAFKIADPTAVKLVQEKTNKPIDHSISLRLANIKAANKLAIIK